MIHYHGLPITPEAAAVKAMKNAHVFVSHRYQEQLSMALEICSSFAVDNGAFSAWKSGTPVTDWREYYRWVSELHRIPAFDFAVIPDVIDGTESDNDTLLAEWPWGKSWIGAPVWHLHESLERLERVAHEYPRICLGSSGSYSRVGSLVWWQRMAEAMDVVCDSDGFSVTKLHGLRMLDPEVFSRFPFASADSTNIARNIGIDSRWRGSYTPPTKSARAVILRERIEQHQSTVRWDRNKLSIQEQLWHGI